MCVCLSVRPKVILYGRRDVKIQQLTCVSALMCVFMRACVCTCDVHIWIRVHVRVSVLLHLCHPLMSVSFEPVTVYLYVLC